MKSGERVILFFAQGMGVGRIPWAPGTFGSILGFPLAGLFLMTGAWVAYLALCGIAIATAVWLSGAAERILGKSDPGPVVIDEVISIPLCMIGWLWWVWRDTGHFPQAEYFFSGSRWLGVLAVFALFRLFDIWKPWPVRQSQELQGGWGVTVDDCLASVYVNVVTLSWLALA